MKKSTIEKSIELGKIKKGELVTEESISNMIIAKIIELTKENEMLKRVFKDKEKCIGCVSGDPGCYGCHLSNADRYLEWRKKQ